MTNEELTMSNEAAKEILLNEIQQWKDNPNLTVGEPLYVALYTAIKALEEQEIRCDSNMEEVAKSFIKDVETVKDQLDGQPCEDCISREAIYEALSEWDEQDVYLPYHFKELVDELPPVTPKAEPCDDAISRKDAVDIINGCAEHFNGYIGTPNDTEVYAYARGVLLGIESNISALPSVMPKGETITEFADRCRECGKMRKGHWIYDKTFENWRCSKCNESPKTLGYVGTADFMAEHFKFCNHCGAKMVEPQESESDD